MMNFALKMMNFALKIATAGSSDEHIPVKPC